MKELLNFLLVLVGNFHAVLLLKPEAISKEGKADAFMFALGSGAVAETDAKVGGVRVLPIDPSPEAMARLRKFVPVAYATKLEPRKGLVGILEPTMVYAYDYLVLANSKVPDEAVYKLVKIMHDNKSALVAGFGALAGFQPERMAKAIVKATTHYEDAKIIAEVSKEIGVPMRGIEISAIPEQEILAKRGW